MHPMMLLHAGHGVSGHLHPSDAAVFAIFAILGAVSILWQRNR